MGWANHNIDMVDTNNISMEANYDIHILGGTYTNMETSNNINMVGTSYYNMEANDLGTYDHIVHLLQDLPRGSTGSFMLRTQSNHRHHTRAVLQPILLHMRRRAAMSDERSQ
jgi:hypothetical protein